MRAPRFLCDSRAPGLPTLHAERQTLPCYADLTIVTVVPDSLDISNSTESITSRMM